MTAPTSLAKHQPRVYFELTDIKKEIGDEDMIEIKIKIETSGLNHWNPPQNTHAKYQALKLFRYEVRSWNLCLYTWSRPAGSSFRPEKLCHPKRSQNLLLLLTCGLSGSNSPERMIDLPREGAEACVSTRITRVIMLCILTASHWMSRIFTRHILILYFPVWLIATLGKLRNLRSRGPWPEKTEWMESTSVPEMRFGCGGDIACNPSADTTLTRPHIFASSTSWSLCPSSVTTMGGLRRSPGRLSLGGCTAIFIWYGDSLFSALFATIARVAGFPFRSTPALFFAFSEAVANIFEVFSSRCFTVVRMLLSAFTCTVCSWFFCTGWVFLIWIIGLGQRFTSTLFHRESFEPPGKQYARWRDSKFYQFWLDWPWRDLETDYRV